MTIVSNSSPIISLARIRRLDMMRSLLGRIAITPTVKLETLGQCPASDEAVHIREAFDSFFDIVEPQTKPHFSRSLDDGEKSVIALALELNASLVLLDDKKAIKEAREFKLAPVSTRDIVFEAEVRGIVSSANSIIKQLSDCGVFI